MQKMPHLAPGISKKGKDGASTSGSYVENVTYLTIRMKRSEHRKQPPKAKERGNP